MKALKLSVLLFTAIVLCSPPLNAETQCPRGIDSIAYPTLGVSQIGVQVTINGEGPFEFILDTGAQITVIDEALATQMALRPQGKIGIISVLQYSPSNLAQVASLKLGGKEATNMPVALQRLDHIRSVDSKIQGILGLDFLRRYDVLIDNTHRVVCLDDSHRMQFAILGDRVPVLRHRPATDSPLEVSPILIPVHLAGDRHQHTVLRIDSGSSAAVLFSNRAEILPWLQKSHASRGTVAGTHSRILLATIPEQNVHIADHFERRISFLTPIGDGHPTEKKLEDGLLPMALFKEILISFRDGFVIFNPHDSCPPEETN